MGTAPEDEVLIEFIPRGNSVKVTAVDAATGLEVSIVGDPKAGRDSLARLAAEKLRYVRDSRRAAAPEETKRGILV